VHFELIQIDFYQFFAFFRHGFSSLRSAGPRLPSYDFAEKSKSFTVRTVPNTLLGL